MVGVKDAVRSATSFVEELYPQAKDIRLEEVEPAGSVWSVVLSFETDERSGLSYVMGTDTRLFKSVSVDSDNGAPLSLKVWKQ